MKRYVQMLMNRFISGNHLKKRVILGLVWNSFGTIFSRACAVITSVLVARILAPVLFGQYGIILNTISMFSTFAGLGLGLTATRYVAENRENDPRKTGRIIALTNLMAVFSGILIMICVQFVADSLAVNQLNAPKLAGMIKLASLLLVPSTISSVQTGSLAGFEEFKAIAKNNTVYGFLLLILSVIGVLYWGLTGILYAQITANLVFAMLNTYEVSKAMKKYQIKIELLSAFSERSVIWKTSIPAMLTNIITVPVLWFTNTLILDGDGGYTQFGIYSAANQWRTILLTFPGIMTGVFIPLLSNMKDNENLEKINALGAWFFVVLCSLPIIAFPELVALIYGDNYKGDIFNTVLIITALVACILSYQEGIIRKIISMNLIWLNLLVNLFWGTFFIGFTLLFRGHGAVGLASAGILSYVISFAMFAPYYLKKKIIRREHLISYRIVLIWISIFGIFLINLTDVGIILRLGLLLITIFFVVKIALEFFQLGKTQFKFARLKSMVMNKAFKIRS